MESDRARRARQANSPSVIPAVIQTDMMSSLVTRRWIIWNKNWRPNRSWRRQRARSRCIAALLRPLCSTASSAASSTTISGEAPDRAVRSRSTSYQCSSRSPQITRRTRTCSQPKSRVEAPAPPEPKAKQAVDETAIPIAGKQKKPEHQEAQKTPQRKHQPMPDQSRSIRRAGRFIDAAQTSSTSGHGQHINRSDFGSLFGWYVDKINRKMDANGYSSLADPHTPQGARAYIEFSIRRDGSRESGAPRSHPAEARPGTRSACAPHSALTPLVRCHRQYRENNLHGFLLLRVLEW